MVSARARFPVRWSQQLVVSVPMRTLPPANLFPLARLGCLMLRHAQPPVTLPHLQGQKYLVTSSRPPPQTFLRVVCQQQEWSLALSVIPSGVRLPPPKDPF